MATTVGRLLYHVDADGTDMERQTRRAAKDAAKGFDDLDKRAKKSSDNQIAMDERVSKNRLANLKKLEERFARLTRDQERDERRLDSARQSYFTRRINRLSQVHRWAERIGMRDQEDLRTVERQSLENDRHLRGFQTKLNNLEREVAIRKNLLDLTEKMADRERVVVDVDVHDLELQQLRATLGTLDKFEKVTVDVEVDGMTLAIAQLTMLERIAKRLDRMTISPNVNMAGVAASAATASAAGGSKGGFLDVLKKIGNIRLETDSVKGLVTIIGLVLAAMQQLAVLSSALGAGIVILAGAVGALALGLGAGIGGIVGMVSRMSEFNEAQEEYNKLVEKGGDLTAEEADRLAELQGVLDAMPAGYRNLKGLGGAFKELGQSMGDSMVNILAPELARLKDNLLPGISTQVTALSDTFAGFLSDISAGFTSDSGIARFKYILEEVNPIFQSLLDGIRNFGSFVTDVFQVSLPYVKDFADGFRDMTAGWDEWASSIEGKSSLATWFERGQRVLGSLGGLVDSLFGTLHSLTSDSAVNRTERLVDSLARMVESLEPTLDFLGRLDIFGIIAQALDTVFRMIAPLMNILAPMGQIITNILIPAFRYLGAVVQIVLSPLTWLAQLFYEIGAYISEWLQPYLEPFLSLLEYLGNTLMNIGSRIFEALLPALDALFGNISDGIGTPEEFGRVLEENVIPWIDKLANNIVEFVVPALSDFIEWAGKAMTAALEWINNNGGIPGIMEKVGESVSAMGLIVEGVFLQLQSLVSFITFDFIGAIGKFSTGAAKIQQGVDQLNAVDWRGLSVGASDHASMYMASGGVLAGPRRIIAGEAGPEAIVPLRRPLSQVDPAVRALSAFAQGLTPMASGGVVGGRSVVIEAGAIVVQGSSDPEATALAVMNRIAERV